MAFPIRYLVPYMATVTATDVGSGRKVTNIQYLRCGIQSASPPAYGNPIAGGGSTATLLTAFEVNWLTHILPRLNANYSYQQTVMVALIGKRYGTPIVAILGLVPSANSQIVTATPHGLTTGQSVSVTGITLPSILNGVWTITVIDDTHFQLNGGNATLPWTGDGSYQVVQGALEWLTADQETHIGAGQLGGVVGDALPLFATSSVRRLNGGIGRHFRSRFSLSPMSEVDVLDGGFTAAQKALMVTALAAYNITMGNGGSDPGSQNSSLFVVSKQLAFTLATPFPSSNLWSAFVTSMIQQRNNGSLVRRKPKLTQIIV